MVYDTIMIGGETILTLPIVGFLGPPITISACSLRYDFEGLPAPPGGGPHTERST